MVRERKLPFTPAKDLEADLERYLRLIVRTKLGGIVNKLTGTPGIPDDLVMLPGGRLFLVELKTDTGDLEPSQKVWMHRAAKVGVVPPVLHGRSEVDAWVASLL